MFEKLAGVIFMFDFLSVLLVSMKELNLSCA